MAEQGLHQDLAGKLLAWYDEHGRVLPWRAPVGIAADPYHVWLSEIMLQQTTVAAVRDYYLKFLALWPTIFDLAAASQDDVLRAWAGLGYYARARNLHACAKDVVTRLKGKFPTTAAELQDLPGIGPYTSAAIASIAFNRPHAAVDGNVERVISRLYAIETPLPLSKPIIRQHAENLVPQQRPGDFAQALMDLGATTCTPRTPDCPRCPWYDPCQARALGIAATLPRKLPKPAIPTRVGTAYWIERPDDFILLHRRPAKGLLGGMMEIPSSPWALNQVELDPPLAATGKMLPRQVEHTFTHFHLRLAVWKATTTDNALPAGDYQWVHRDDLGREALPTLMRKVVALATSADLVDMG